MIKLLNLLIESKKEKETFEDFATKRAEGAATIAKTAEEKGGLAMLTYNHFFVKAPYYKKAINGKFDIEVAKKEFDEILKNISTNMSQIEFQKEMGRLEVLGELLIRDKKTIKLKEQLKEDCWKGYKQIGMKKKGKRQVPNCVPIEELNEYFPSDPDSLNKALKDIQKLGYRNPLNPREIIIDETVCIEIVIFDRQLHLSSIRSLNKGQGNASKIMQKIVDIADKYKVTIDLDPEPFSNGEDILSKSQLVKFYKKFGFKLEKGGGGGMERVAK